MGTPKLRRRRTALAAGLATIAIAVGVAAAPAQAVDKTKYIALGDSYAAGQGAGPYLDACYRSDSSYAELAADVKAVKLVTNAACSGKTTQDVISSQLKKLNPSTELVTITAGGNDLGFGAIVTNCITAVFNPAAAGACADASATAKALITSGKLAGNVAAMIQSVHAAAPNAKIVVTGYPYLYDPIPAGRTDSLSQFIYQATALADGLNGSIALAAGARYVDVRGAFLGHGIISTDPWINLDLANPRSADNFHPNAKGYLAYYKTLKSAGAYPAS
jgi:lysophospholipase L1-like esterase